MIRRGMLIAMLALATALIGSEALAEFAKVPPDALRYLKLARGKKCRDGLVFIDGKYIPPPYVVSRYGTAITINDIQVTGQVIAWNEFLKTQSGVTVVQGETPAAAETTDEEPEVEEEEEEEDEDDPLADLFDDEPKPAKKKTAKKSTYKRAAPKPQVTYKLNGEFVANDASKKLLDRIDRYRADINRNLLAGGFYFFGSNYRAIGGQSRETKRLLANLPEIMRDSSTAAELVAGAKRNGYSSYINSTVAAGLIKHRYLYTQLMQRRSEMGGDILNLTK